MISTWQIGSDSKANAKDMNQLAVWSWGLKFLRYVWVPVWVPKSGYLDPYSTHLHTSPQSLHLDPTSVAWPSGLPSLAVVGAFYASGGSVGGFFFHWNRWNLWVIKGWKSHRFDNPQILEISSFDNLAFWKLDEVRLFVRILTPQLACLAC